MAVQSSHVYSCASDEAYLMEIRDICLFPRFRFPQFSGCFECIDTNTYKEKITHGSGIDIDLEILSFRDLSARSRSSVHCSPFSATVQMMFKYVGPIGVLILGSN